MSEWTAADRTHHVWVRFTVPGETQAQAESMLQRTLENPNLFWERLKEWDWYVYDSYDMGEALDYL